MPAFRTAPLLDTQLQEKAVGRLEQPPEAIAWDNLMLWSMIQGADRAIIVGQDIVRKSAGSLSSRRDHIDVCKGGGKQ